MALYDAWHYLMIIRLKRIKSRKQCDAHAACLFYCHFAVAAAAANEISRAALHLTRNEFIIAHITCFCPSCPSHSSTPARHLQPPQPRPSYGTLIKRMLISSHAHFHRYRCVRYVALIVHLSSGSIPVSWTENHRQIFSNKKKITCTQFVTENMLTPKVGVTLSLIT